VTFIIISILLALENSVFTYCVLCLDLSVTFLTERFRFRFALPGLGFSRFALPGLDFSRPDLVFVLLATRVPDFVNKFSVRVGRSCCRLWWSSLSRSQCRQESPPQGLIFPLGNLGPFSRSYRPDPFSSVCNQIRRRSVGSRA
jgi:hypothetical protein